VQRGISHFSGEIVATDHVEEVSGLVANGSGSTWTDVHRELWIRPWQGAERRFTFTNADVPARSGHRVTLLLASGRPVALINFSTEQYVNLVAPRQFELFGAVEAFGFAGFLIVAGFAGSPGLITLVVGSAAYGSVKWFMRQQSYREAWSAVEAEIGRVIAHPPARALAEDMQRGAF
jgi:hypothetical protein